MNPNGELMDVASLVGNKEGYKPLVVRCKQLTFGRYQPGSYVSYIHLDRLYTKNHH